MADREQRQTHDRPRLEIDLTGPERAGDLNEVLAFLVHELRNPLAVVKGFSAALEKATDRMDVDVIRSSTSAIKRNAQHLGDIVDSIADLYSLTTGGLKLNLVEKLISEVVLETVADLEPVLDGKEVDVQVHDDAALHLDPVRIRQVLINLLSNAAKYSPAESRVVISSTRHDGWISISIDDEGPGIPKEKAGELFQKFSRLGNGVSGMGIGLFISRGIARAHGGDVTLEPSEKGCRFVVHLPT